MGRRSQVLVVCGPTATGKSALAITLAERFNGEIVNADSRQVYRYMDIGTAKPTAEQQESVPHHLLDIVNPDDPFTLATYLQQARKVLSSIQDGSRLPVVVGGTGLYTRALIQGFDVPAVAPNDQLRAELEALAATMGSAALLARLQAIDPVVASTIDGQNTRRVIRAVEIAETVGPIHRKKNPPYDSLVLGLTADYATLYDRADARIDAMMSAGFLEEVTTLTRRGYGSHLPSFSSLGYRELAAYLQGTCTIDDAVQATKYATHRFIRRQSTWFRREPGLQPVDITGANMADHVCELVSSWLER